MNVSDFGKIGGESVKKIVLQSGEHRVSLLNYGCIVQSWELATGHSHRQLVLGFDSLDDYEQHSRSFGIIAGRVANRIEQARFQHKGLTYQLSRNHGDHHLHGGHIGLGRRVWKIDSVTDQSVRFTYRSPAGEEGYPGEVEFVIIVQVGEDGIEFDMQGFPDRETPINLAQHSYYNLDALPVARLDTGPESGPETDPETENAMHERNIRHHRLQVQASHWLPVDVTLIPTGEVRSVEQSAADTAFDFRQPVIIAEQAENPERPAYDHHLVLDSSVVAESQQWPPEKPAARLESSDREVALQLYTDQPGIQLYTAAPLDVPVAGLDQCRYGANAGICLEAQHFPDAPNHSQTNNRFASIFYSPEKPYRQRLRLKITKPQENRP